LAVPLLWRKRRKSVRGKVLLISFTRHQIEGPTRIAGEIKEGYPMHSLIVRFANDRSAATAIEYGLIAAGISIAIIAVVFVIGSELNATFSSVSAQLK
jgi:pilus assembly protein Flp/PilA